MKPILSGAIDFWVDKNRKLSLIQKVKQIIREEEDHANDAYIALGKYYYHHLRDQTNDETEFYCSEAEYAEHRLQRAERKLSELMRGKVPQDYDQDDLDAYFGDCETGCGGSCSTCGSGCNPIEWNFDERQDAAEVEAGSMDVEMPPHMQEAFDAKKDAE